MVQSAVFWVRIIGQVYCHKMLNDGIFPDNTRANVRILGKRIPGPNGVDYVKFGNLNIKVSVGGAKFRLENLFNGDRTLGEIGNTVINENAQLFIEELIPGFEKSLSKTFLEIANDILTDVTYDEMFPDV